LYLCRHPRPPPEAPALQQSLRQVAGARSVKAGKVCWPYSALGNTCMKRADVMAGADRTKLGIEGVIGCRAGSSDPWWCKLADMTVSASFSM
ncbi:hypothetical protein, partial [Mesorhizobium waimense]|uniref:hypothetical protein n=1 Tax=Mesorhizobium waimense TaxID=1300307 RepID=UPI001ABF5982